MLEHICHQSPAEKIKTFNERKIFPKERKITWEGTPYRGLLLLVRPPQVHVCLKEWSLSEGP